MSNYSESYFDKLSPNTSWYKVFHLIPVGAKVLDIGCSSGNFGKELKDHKSCAVDGIELDERDIKFASKKLDTVWRLNIETDSLNEIKAGKYDVIYFGDVIEHLINPIATLKRIRPLLKPEGKVVFSIPNMGHIGVRLDLLGGEFDYTETGLLDKTHLHFYTQKEVLRVFEGAGYEIESLDFVQKDYPHQLLEAQLKRYGLRAGPKFYKKMQETEASAFQFVGAAKAGKIKTRRRKRFGPIDLFDKFYNDTLFNHQLEILNHQKQIADLESALRLRDKQPYRNVLRHVKRKVVRR